MDVLRENREVLDPATVHLPVMLDRCVELLSVSLNKPESIYVDGTLGMGGHAEAVLQANPNATLVGIDRDQQALDLATQRLSKYSDRVHLVHARYDQLDQVLDDLDIAGIDAILLDLGLSSLQIDQRDRGFSYSVDAPLDMRMNQEDDLDAAEVINTYSQAELARIFSWYGEEKFANRIAKAVVENRPIESSNQLNEVISAAIPASARYSGGHPAKRVFQALRIEVNRELEGLDSVLPKALDALKLGGRFAVLSYHSLEDRRVKQAFREASTDQVPPGLPIVPDQYQAKFSLLTRGAEKPTSDEIAKNPRSASARLRAITRVGVNK